MEIGFGFIPGFEINPWDFIKNLVLKISVNIILNWEMILLKIGYWPMGLYNRRQVCTHLSDLAIRFYG